MGSIHADLTGAELHISKTNVSTVDPNGVVTAGVIGEFYFNSTNDSLWVAEAVTNSDWLEVGHTASDTLAEVLANGNTSGANNLIIDAGQKITITDAPTLGTDGANKDYVDAQNAGDVDGPASATDNALARFDGITGKLVQDSLALLTDAGAMSGLTLLNVDNLQLDGNTLSTTDTNGNLILSPNGTGEVQFASSVLNGITQLSVDNLRLDGNTLSSTDTNGNVVLDPNGTGFINASSSLISNVTDPVSGSDAATKDYVDTADALLIPGPGTVTDNALVRFDLTTGLLIQNSVALLTDVGVLSGITLLDVDNLRLDGNTLSTTDTNGDLLLNPNGSGKVDVVGNLEVLSNITITNGDMVIGENTDTDQKSITFRTDDGDAVISYETDGELRFSLPDNMSFEYFVDGIKYYNLSKQIFNADVQAFDLGSNDLSGSVTFDLINANGKATLRLGSGGDSDNLTIEANDNGDITNAIDAGAGVFLWEQDAVVLMKLDDGLGLVVNQTVDIVDSRMTLGAASVSGDIDFNITNDEGTARIRLGSGVNDDDLTIELFDDGVLRLKTALASNIVLEVNSVDVVTVSEDDLILDGDLIFTGQVVGPDAIIENIIAGESIEYSDGSTQIQAASPDGFAWNIETGLFLQSLPIVTQTSTPRGVFFKPDGLQMYVIAETEATVFEYALTTAWDLSTATINQSFVVSTEESLPEGFCFRQDGLRMYIIGQSVDVNEYVLSTPWDISSASALQLFSVSTEQATPVDVSFKPDGSRMYIIGKGPNRIDEYILSTPWSVITAVANDNFSTSTEDANPESITFKPDGTRMYMVGVTNDTVFEYSLTEPWILGTAFYTGRSFSVADEDVFPHGAFFKPDATKMYVCGSTGNQLLEYDMGLDVQGKINTKFGTVSVNPSSIIEILDVADLEKLAVSNVITVSGPMVFHFKASVTTAIRFVLDSSAADLRLVDVGEGNTYIYIGTSAFFTSAAGGDIDVQNFDVIAAVPGTVLYDFQGIREGLALDFISVQSFVLFFNFDPGSITRLSTGERGPAVSFDNVVFLNSTASLILDTLATLDVDVPTWARTNTGISLPFFDVRNSGQRRTEIDIRNAVGELGTGESLVRIGPELKYFSRIIVADNTIDIASANGIFDTSGATAVFDSIANNSITTVTINTVSDNGGVAVFNHTGTSPLLGSTVTIFGFTTNTEYNQTARVTLTTATTFEVDFIAFGTSEAGSYLVNGVTVTSNAHGLSNDTGLSLSGDNNTDYDNGYVIYNSQTNTFDVDAVFTETIIGQWSTAGLDQSDPRVLARGNPATETSHYIGAAFVNANAVANGVIVNNEFADIDFGSSVGLSQSVSLERFKLINDVNGTFEYTGLEPFSGAITYDFTVESSGGTVDFRFKWMKTITTVYTASTIAFVDSNPDTITDSANGFITAGFLPGDTLEITGSTSNDGAYTIETIAPGTITLITSDTLVAETAGASVTITGIFGNLGDNVEALVAVGSDAQSVSKTYPVKLTTGVRIKPQITRNSGSSGITTTHATVHISQ